MAGFRDKVDTSGFIKAKKASTRVKLSMATNFEEALKKRNLSVYVEKQKPSRRVSTAAVAKIKVESYSGHTRFMKKYFYRFDLGMDPLICDICGCTSHNGRPIIMDMDHIDGNPYNGKLTNIRFICPNCHSQTDTFKNRTKTIEQIYEEKLTLQMLGAMEYGRCSE